MAAWPYPSSLMFGMVATAEPNSVIRLDLDNELEDARFVDKAFIKAALEQRASFTRQEVQRFENPVSSKESGISPDDQIRLPPASAIAHQLILAFANGELSRD